MARTQQRPPADQARIPQYEWALDAQGHPVPIERAERGVEYVCPLCGGRMIPRQGAIKQHHYAHEEETACPPDAVARAAAVRWVRLQLAGCLARRQSVMITWPCQLCQQPHSANLLHEIDAVREHHPWHDWMADIALLDPRRTLRAVILFDTPAPDALQAYTACGVTALVVSPERLRGQGFRLGDLLLGAVIYGGACATQAAIARQGIVTDIQTLRTLLGAAASEPPYYAHGPLLAQGAVAYTLELGNRKLWLPPVLWQRAIGGVMHAVSETVQVIIQEWPQADDATVALYYVTVKDAHAVAVRRFGPAEPVHAHLAASSPRDPQAAAAAIARGFACD